MFKVQQQLGERSADRSQRYWKGIMEKLELLTLFFYLLHFTTYTKIESLVQQSSMHP